MPYDVDIGDGADALGQNQLTDALDGTYWVSGWDATLGTGDLEVDIAAGSGAVAGTDVSTGSTQTIDFTGDPDSTDPRKAVIYVDSGGTVQKSLGTPQPVDPSGEIRFRTYNPSPPASVSGVVVAEVWLAAGETVLESADVRDRRVANQAASISSPNAPDYVEDLNSPFTQTNSISITGTISGDYDYIQMFISAVDLDVDATANVSLQINGDSGANYDYVDFSRTETTGETSWPSVINMNALSGGEFKNTASLELRQSVNDGVAVQSVPRNTLGTGTGTEHGVNFNTSLPVNTFTLSRGDANADWRVEVYGKTIE